MKNALFYMFLTTQNALFYKFPDFNMLPYHTEGKRLVKIGISFDISYSSVNHPSSVQLIFF